MSLGMYNSNICLRPQKKNRLFDDADATPRQPSNRNQCRTISGIRTSNDRRHLPALKPSVVITALNAVAVTALPVALRAPALGTTQGQAFSGYLAASASVSLCILTLTVQSLLTPFMPRH